ncbi:uncharacterized protein KZ484_020486 [Pholidichthys leucotaenia]
MGKAAAETPINRATLMSNWVLHDRLQGGMLSLPCQKGDLGDKGQMGTSGFAGPKGDRGFKGEKGDRGTMGPPGAQGPQGETGTCPAICESPPGQKGEQGQPGPPGARGLPGVKGSEGSKGGMGDKGDRGRPGSPGVNGEKGDRGDQGVCTCTDGADGIDGAKGERGSKGDKGDTGTQGIQGSTGPKGNTGNMGLMGVPGPCSPAIQSAFSASLEESFPKPDFPIAFTRIHTNQQMHFQSPGIYTAPVNGTYIFSFSLAVREKPIKVGLFLNFIPVVKVTEANTPSTTSQSVVLHLKMGDRIWMQVKDSLTNGMYQGVEYTSTFSGYLLYPDTCDLVSGRNLPVHGTPGTPEDSHYSWEMKLCGLSNGVSRYSISCSMACSQDVDHAEKIPK